MTTKASEKDDEGARDFALFLRHIDDGAIHEEASAELHALATKLSRHVDTHGGKAKGQLTVTLNLTALPNGTVDVLADVKVKEPKVVRPRSVFWFTKGNNLSPDNPRQQKLALREVPPASREKARDIAPENVPRSV